MTTAHSHLFVRFAETPADLHAVQRLRYDVFVAELGGSGAGVDHGTMTEADRFDDEARHLLLCDGDHVVGAYRLVDQEAADRVGQYYSEAEYDLTPLRTSGRKLLEVGRSCIHPDYRSGLGLMHLWTALADYVAAQDIEVIFGVASFHGSDPQVHADALAHLATHYMAAPEICPKSRVYHDMHGPALSGAQKKAALAAMPSLIKSYLRLGGVIGDGAFVDHAFNTTDVCLILDTASLNARAALMLPRGEADG